MSPLSLHTSGLELRNDDTRRRVLCSSVDLLELACEDGGEALQVHSRLFDIEGKLAHSHVSHERLVGLHVASFFP